MHVADLMQVDSIGALREHHDIEIAGHLHKILSAFTAFAEMSTVGVPARVQNRVSEALYADFHFMYITKCSIPL